MRVVYLLYICIVKASVHYPWSGVASEVQQGTTTVSYDWNGIGSESQTQGPIEACTASSHSCGCCRMVRDVNFMKDYFNTTLSELEKDVQSINQSLDAIHAHRVAFSASLFEESGFQCEEPTASNKVIKYKHVFINVGNAYSNVTGTFSVPFSGVYSLTVTVYSDSGSSVIELAACASLYRNDEKLASARDRNTNDHEDSATIVLVETLNAGDEVTVQSAEDCMLCDEGRYNTFSAFLLYPIWEETA